MLVHCYSNLTLHAEALQSSLAPGEQVRILARLREYDVPVEGRATVWAEIEQPGGGQFAQSLTPRPSGEHVGLFSTTAPGVYRIRVRAQGETFYGNRFAREQTVTAVAVPGGGTTPQPGGGDERGGLLDLICCLLGTEAIRPEALERLGIDPGLARRCLARLCRERSTNDADDASPR